MLPLPCLKKLDWKAQKNLNIDKIDAQYCFVVDDDFRVATAGCSLNKVEGKFMGKASHAGVEPEKGINSLLMFSKTMMKLADKGILGRIDHETTSNLIVKEGGLATNIIPEHTKFEGEIRSLDEEKLKNVMNEFEKVFNDTAKEMGGKVDLEFKREFTAFKVKKDHPIISIVERAAKSVISH